MPTAIESDPLLRKKLRKARRKGPSVNASARRPPLVAKRRGRRARLGLVVGLGLWLVASGVNAVGDEGADGRFTRRDSSHFTLFQDVDIDQSGGFYGSRRFEQDLLAELEKAFDRLDRLLGLRPDRKLEVFIWDPVLFDARYAGLFTFPAAGFYGGAIHIRGATEVTPSLVRTLHHELVHAAFDAVAPRVALPAWLNEGFAEWFESRAVGQRRLSGRDFAVLAQLAGEGRLFALADLSARSFGGFGPEAASIAYFESRAFVFHLATLYGEAALVRFSDTLLRTRNLDRAARKAFRKDLAALEAEFREAAGAR